MSIERSDQDGVDWGVQLLGTAPVVSGEDRLAHGRERMDEVYSGPYGADGGDGDDDWGWSRSDWVPSSQRY